MNRQWQSPLTEATITTNTPTVVEIKAPNRGSLRTVSLAVKGLSPTTSPQVKIYTQQAAANVAAATWLLDLSVPGNLATVNAQYATLPSGNPDFYLVTRDILTGADGRLLTNTINLPYVNQDGNITFPGQSLWFVVLCQDASIAAGPLNLVIGITVETPTFL